MTVHVPSTKIAPFADLTAPYDLNLAAMVPTAPVDAVIHINRDGVTPSIAERDRGKVLGRFLPANGRQPDRWCALKRDKGQPSILVTGATPEEQEEFLDWRTPNMSLLGHWYPGVDADSNSPDAARLVDNAMAKVFGLEIPMRARSNSDRVLYVLKAVVPGAVDSWTIEYRLAEDGPGLTHKLESKAARTQWVATGSNLKGNYAWAPGADLREIGDAGLITVTNENMTRLREVFKQDLADAGGEIIADADGTGGAQCEEWDPATVEPLIPPEDLLKALEDMPNTEANFPDRPIGLVAAVKAALGNRAEEFRDEVCAVLVKTSGGWCEAEYIERVWDSLPLVKVDRFALDTHFRRHGITVLAGAHFPAGTDDQANTAAVIAAGNASLDSEYHRLKAKWESGYRVMTQNIATGDNFPVIRAKALIGTVLKVDDVWRNNAGDADLQALVREIQSHKNLKSRSGFNDFVNDLRATHPKGIYTKTMKDVRRRMGEMVAYKDSQGNTLFALNLSPEPKAQELARLPLSRDKAVREQAEADLKLFLDFVRRGFGTLADFELNVMADMLQTGKRPGHMLFLVGDQGVGKSLYIDFCMRSLNGTYEDSPNGELLGHELLSDTRRRFALSNKEGCRGVNINELTVVPKHQRTEVVTFFKQIVDPSSKNDRVQIEKKNVDKAFVANDFRMFMSTNYEDALRPEPGDRRTEYVSWGINDANHPGPEYFKELYNILEDDARLSTIVRYWLTKNTAGYDRTAKPPSSLAKIEAEILSDDLSDAARHAEAALLKFRTDKRTIFDLKEFAQVMTAMGELEFKNTGDGGRPEKPYTFKAPDKVMRDVLNHIARQSSALQPLKSGQNLPKVYVMKNEDGTVSKLVRELNGMKPRGVLDAMAVDRKDHPFGSYHPMEQFAGPVDVLGGDFVNDNDGSGTDVTRKAASS